MKKIKIVGLGCMAALVLCGCQKPKETVESQSETPAIGTTEGAQETTPATAPEAPDTLAITEGKLTWKDTGAEGYRIYKGSSRLADDFTAVEGALLTDTSYALEPSDYSYYKVAAINGGVESELTEAVSQEMALFGENVYIYDPADDPAEVNRELFKMFNKQETAQFQDRRYAVLFKPGEYAEEIQPQIGFYMEVMGLGRTPLETTLQSLNCPATWLGNDSNHNATCNFWRAAANLQVNSNVMWAVSQATSMRRMQINGNLALHDQYGWASGGFLSDTVITGIADSGSQQQWLSRNCDWRMWSGENWNIVFVGTEEGKAPTGTWPARTYTTVAGTPKGQEKPYLICEDGVYSVFVPAWQTETTGVSWIDGPKGEVIPLDAFYVAHPETDTAKTLNEALEEGKHLLLTPGIYELEETIEVTKPDTIVLGIGYATLRPIAGNGCIHTADVDGIKIGGILFDAGTTESETLLQVGDTDGESDHSENPILLSDVFFRVGGVVNGETAVQNCVTIHSNDVIGDNFWVWRADHGDGVAWTTNTAPNGIIVNGDRVTIYALMVEHFQEYQTVWNGEEGSVYFYQSELPYDVPKQSVWQSHDGTMNGYASYYVADNVTTHTAYGIGIYSYNRDAVVEEYCAMEVPEVEGMDIHNVCSVMITGNPGITHVIDGYGANAYSGGTRSVIVDFQQILAKATEKAAEEATAEMGVETTTE